MARNLTDLVKALSQAQYEIGQIADELQQHCDEIDETVNYDAWEQLQIVTDQTKRLNTHVEDAAISLDGYVADFVTGEVTL